VAPALPWRKATGELLAQRLFWPAWAGTGTVVVAVLLGARGFAPLIAFGLGGFAAGSAIRQVVLATRRQGWRGFVGRTNGGMIVHIGVVLIAVALAASSSFDTVREVTMKVGDTVTVAGHELHYLGGHTVKLSNKTSLRARVRVDGRTFEPAINRFPVGEQSIGTPAVDTSPKEDVYLSLTKAPGDDAGQSIGLRVVVQPMIMWLWLGGLVMALGTILAAFPGRRRNPIDPVSAPVPGATRAGPDEPAPAEASGDGGEGERAPVVVGA
jgi:cytochrome c-type biogenesis protein CcmF